MRITKLDRFELIAELASGGMGTVFLARLGGAGGFQRLCAIKRLHEHLARHPEFIEMFLDEARLAARIHHPNVVPILEIGTTDAGYYLVMEYVEGDTAGHLYYCATQERKTIPGRVAVRIVLDALAGLHAAHEGRDDEGQPLEIVHRDVSPHNIMVSVDGVARITDFGIARASSRLAITRTGQLKGKIAYMAPEQARSEKVDRRADVFSMGICLWEMLARQRLFKAEGEGETLNRLLYEEVPSLREVAPSVPRELEAVCMKALARDMDKRYATAAEFSDALEKAARSVDELGTHREVAKALVDVLGTDLSERRAEIRSFLADTERRSLAPPAQSSGSLLPPRGAQVSVYVPPLFESGSLRAHTGEPVRGEGRKTRSFHFSVVAVLAVVGLFGAARLWRDHTRTTSSGSVTASRPAPTATSPASPASPGETVHPADALPAAPSLDAVGTAVVATNPETIHPAVAAAVQTVSIRTPAAAKTTVAVAKHQPTVAPQASADAPQSPIVPPEMQRNPYR